MKQGLLLLFALLTLNTAKSFSQNPTTKIFSHQVSKGDMTYIMPKGYTELKENFYFACDRYLSAPIHKSIIKKDKNIVVGIYVGAYSNISKKELARTYSAAAMFGRKFEMDSNYVNGAKVAADTINHQIVYLSKVTLAKDCNADRGVVFVRKCTTPMYGIMQKNNYIIAGEKTYDSLKHFDKKYNHHKVVSISKDGRGHIELYYLYTDAISEKKINKEIRKTIKMLRFNN